MSAILRRTCAGMSTYVSVVISPATTTRPVVISVSQATRPVGSSASTASSTVSEIWSAILSGWPSVTDSDVKRNSRAAIAAGKLVDFEKSEKCAQGSVLASVGHERAQRLQVATQSLRVGRRRDQGGSLGQIDIGEPGVLLRRPRRVEGVLEPIAVGELRGAAAEVLQRIERRRDDDDIVEGLDRDPDRVGHEPKQRLDRPLRAGG